MDKVFNGYIKIDPKIEVGDKVILDADYKNAIEVIVLQLGDIFARIKSGDLEWSVVRGRLSSIKTEKVCT